MTSALTSSNAGAARLRQLLAERDPILAPGAYDAWSARLVERAGFPAVYMTGFGVSASLAGLPDAGLLTMTEMVDQARRIVDAVSVPVIADADTGYGNPLNVLRTARAYERAGVAAIHLEDQVAPKKCGHTEGKQVIPAEEMVEKIRAARAARRSPDFLVIARTDARAVEGLGAAIERARRYREAGADVLFVEAPQDEEEVEAVARAFPDTPLLFNWAEGGKTPPLGLDRLRALGFRIVIFPISALLAATRAIADVLACIRAEGTPLGAMERLSRFGDFLEWVGFPEVRELERRFGGGPPGDPRVP
jgi:2-methylisocitrate lyase-like PEP mutase family enzyme